MKAKARALPSDSLLDADEPAPFELHLPHGISDVLLVCDHAGHRLPRALGALGLLDPQLGSHIAWDLGVAGVAMRLAGRLDATLVMQPYSRLAIDCSRAPGAPDAIAQEGEWGPVPGNQSLDIDQVAARRSAIFDPYHDALRKLIDDRLREQRPTLLLALHSFTPTFRSEIRPWHVGVMHRRDARTATCLIDLLRRDDRLVIGDNEPYALDETLDYTLPVHGQARGLAHVGIEIRQDLIADEAAQNTWAGRLASLLRQVILAGREA